MKKAFSVLICFLLVLSISLTATAENFFTLNPVLFIGNYSFDFSDLENERNSLSVTDANGSLGLLLPFEPIQNFSGSAIVSFSLTFNSPDKDLSSMIQSSLTLNYTDSSNHGREYPIGYGSNKVATMTQQLNKFYFTRTYSSTNGDSVLNYCTLNFYIVYQNIPSTFDNYFIKISVPSDVTSLFIKANEPVILLVDGVSEDVASSVDSIAGSASSINSGIQSLNTDLTNAIANSEHNTLNSLARVEQAISDFKNSYTQMQTEADQSTLESLKQEVADKSNEIVNSVTEKISIDYSAIETGFNSLFTALSNHSDNATLTLPAGSVTIAGTSYTFWDEQTVSLNDVLQHDIVKMLLYPIRLIVYVGFAFYCLDFISKLESLITMNRSDV